MLGMGSVVTNSVADFHLAIGHPARSIGCICRCGKLLIRFSEQGVFSKDELSCEACTLRYRVKNGIVAELDPPT